MFPFSAGLDDRDEIGDHEQDGDEIDPEDSFDDDCGRRESSKRTRTRIDVDDHRGGKGGKKLSGRQINKPGKGK